MRGCAALYNGHLLSTNQPQQPFLTNKRPNNANEMTLPSGAPESFCVWEVLLPSRGRLAKTTSAHRSAIIASRCFSPFPMQEVRRRLRFLRKIGGEGRPRDAARKGEYQRVPPPPTHASMVQGRKKSSQSKEKTPSSLATIILALRQSPPRLPPTAVVFWCVCVCLCLYWMESSSMATPSAPHTAAIHDTKKDEADPLETAKWTRFLPKAFGIQEAVRQSSYRWCVREGGMWGIATGTAMSL